MTRQEIMEILAEEFNIEADENGEYDINDYDWQAGCYMNESWLCLAKIVKLIERMIVEED